MPKARAAAEKALEIDDSLVQAHATLAYSLWCYDWNYTAAEEEFKKAISLDPRYATEYHWYGLLLISLSRTDEAVTQLHRARELDPLSTIIQSNLARAHVYARQPDRGIEEGRRVQRTFAPNHMRLAEAYVVKGLPEQAVAEYQEAADVSGRNPLGLWSLGLAQALAGRRSEARKTIDELKARAAQRYVSPVYIAMAYAEVGQKDDALEWLEKAYADHSWDLVFLGVNPLWDSIRHDPRFGDLLRRLNLTPQGS